MLCLLLVVFCHRDNSASSLKHALFLHSWAIIWLLHTKLHYHYLAPAHKASLSLSGSCTQCFTIIIWLLHTTLHYHYLAPTCTQHFNCRIQADSAAYCSNARGKTLPPAASTTATSTNWSHGFANDAGLHCHTWAWSPSNSRSRAKRAAHQAQNYQAAYQRGGAHGACHGHWLHRQYL
jgi:hypothetical protein